MQDSLVGNSGNTGVENREATTAQYLLAGRAGC